MIPWLETCTTSPNDRGRIIVDVLLFLNSVVNKSHSPRHKRNVLQIEGNAKAHSFVSSSLSHQ